MFICHTSRILCLIPMSFKSYINLQDLYVSKYKFFPGTVGLGLLVTPQYYNFKSIQQSYCHKCFQSTKQQIISLLFP